MLLLRTAYCLIQVPQPSRACPSSKDRFEFYCVDTLFELPKISYFPLNAGSSSAAYSHPTKASGL